MSDEAVSTVIGFILMVLIAVTFIALLQSVMLPEWNKAKEIEHSEEIRYDFSKIGEAVTLSAISGKNSMVSLKASLSYPERPFLISPKFASGTISTKELSISVKSDFINFIEKTHAIILSPNYYYSMKPEFIFEHTAAFRSYENQSIVISEQSSFQKSTVNVYIINATFPNLAVTQPVNLIFGPVSYGGKVFVENAWVNFTSTNPEYWYHSLRNVSPDWAVFRDNDTISVHTRNVYLSVSYLVVQASVAGSTETNLSMQPYDIRRVRVANQSLTVGESKEFSAIVVDRFGNPVPNVKVEFDASGGTLDRLDGNTDDSGEVSTFFTASTTPSGYVRFSCRACVNTSSVSYSLTITEPKGGAYAINWERSEYIAVGSEGQVTEVDMRANTTPKAIYATVEFVTDNPYAVFNPRQTQTDATGNATTTLQITPQPDWDWLTIIRAFATTLASGDTTIVKFYLTKIWRVDIYEDFINGIFQNTQLIGDPGQDSQVILEQNTVNWLSGWSFRVPITVSSSSDLNSYQILIVVDTASLISAAKMRADCGDIRFTQSDGVSELNYWIESGCNSGSTRIWVRTDLVAGNNLIYMYYGNDYATSQSSLQSTFDLVGEAGMISVGGDEITVSLANSYTNPRVFASPVLSPGSYRSGVPTAQHHLITVVSTSYFRIKQVESPSAGDGTIDTTQIAYLVLEDGIYYIGTSLLAEVGEVTASGSYSTISLQTSFPSPPAILADIQEPGSIGANIYEATYARIDRAATTSFRLQVEEDDDSYPPNGLRASTAYLAIEQGVDSVFGIEARKTGDSITHSFTSISFSTSYSSPPVVVAQLDSEDGWNSFYAVERDVTSTSFQLAGEEPASWDGPHTTEEFSWISVPGGAIYGRKYTPSEPSVTFGAEESVQYVSAGNYSSYVKDLGTNSTVKNFLWDGGITSATDIEFYIRASNTSFTTDSPTPNWIYVGRASDGTSFNLSAQNIIGRYVQWRALLSTSDPIRTPLLDEVTVGYQTII